jgi:hypothetical protein
MTVFAPNARRDHISRRTGETSKWVECLGIEHVDGGLLTCTNRGRVDRHKRAIADVYLPVCEFKVPSRACAISLPNRLKHPTFGITDLHRCLNLVHRTSMVAFNCVVLFFYLGEPPADQPSEGAAVAVGEGLASADPSFNAG